MILRELVLVNFRNPSVIAPFTISDHTRLLCRIATTIEQLGNDGEDGKSDEGSNGADDYWFGQFACCLFLGKIPDS